MGSSQNCGHEVTQYDHHCGQCGALLQMTHKLLKAIQEDNEEAIIQLYKMVYNDVYNHFLELGLNRDEIPQLVDQAYQEFLEHSRDITSLDAFEPFFMGICDHVVFTYLKDHHQEPQELDREVFVKPTQHSIHKMLKNHKKAFASKKKSFKGMVLAVVMAILLAGVCGYLTYHQVNKVPVAFKKVQKDYAVVENHYEQRMLL